MKVFYDSDADLDLIKEKTRSGLVSIATGTDYIKK